MTERLKGSNTEQEKISRRSLITGLVGAVATTVAARHIERGVMLNPPPLDIREATIDRTIEGVELYSISTLENDGNESILTVCKGRLLYEPTGEFFGGPMWYTHRGGNGQAPTREVLEKAEEEGKEGPLILDVDANLIKGVVYAEHGIAYKSDAPIMGHLPVIVDINEGEFRIGNLETYKEVVAYVARLQKEFDRPIALSIELKRSDENGEFSVQVLRAMCAINQMYGIPALMHSPRPDQFDAICREVAEAV